MALNQAQLVALINANLPDNITRDISPLDVREVLYEVVDSYFNVVTDGANVGMCEFNTGQSYSNGCGVFFEDDIYQANVSGSTTAGPFLPSEWIKRAPFSSETANFITKDEGIELDPTKKLVLLGDDVSIVGLDTGFYEANAVATSIGLDQEYPVIGKSYLQVMRGSSNSRSLHTIIPFNDVSKMYIRNLNSDWILLDLGTETLNFINGAQKIGTDVQVGGQFSNITLSASADTSSFNIVGNGQVNVTASATSINGIANITQGNNTFRLNNAGVFISSNSDVDVFNLKPSNIATYKQDYFGSGATSTADLNIPSFKLVKNYVLDQAAAFATGAQFSNGLSATTIITSAATATTVGLGAPLVVDTEIELSGRTFDFTGENSKLSLSDNSLKAFNAVPSSNLGFRAEVNDTYAGLIYSDSAQTSDFVSVKTKAGNIELLGSMTHNGSSAIISNNLTQLNAEDIRMTTIPEVDVPAMGEQVVIRDPADGSLKRIDIANLGLSGQTGSTIVSSPFDYANNNTGILPLSGSNEVTGSFASVVGGQGNITSAPNSIVGGLNNSASTFASVAFGSTNQSNGYASFAEGSNNEVTNNAFAGHAEGSDNIADGFSSHAEGKNNASNGYAGHVEGAYNLAQDFCDHAEGYQTVASGSSSHAEGNGSVAGAFVSHAEGYNTQALGSFSHTEGMNTKTDGAGSHAEGVGTFAGTYASHSQGYLSSANTYASHAGGAITVADGAFAFAHGSNSKANNAGSVVLGGGYSEANGSYSVILGTVNSNADGSLSMIASSEFSEVEADANHSVIIGGRHNKVLSGVTGSTVLGGSLQTATTNNTVYGVNFDASGQILSGGTDISNLFQTSPSPFTSGDGIYAIVPKEGGNTADGNYAMVAGGTSNAASGDYSHAEGIVSTASGNYSHAEGISTTASNTASHAEGDGTYASGENSHAEGQNTNATGDESHAQGRNTNADGTSSHAGGVSCTATGDFSFVHSAGSTVTPNYGAILGGSNNDLLAGANNSVILGGNGINGASANTVYTPSLDVQGIYYSGGTPLTDIFSTIGNIPVTSITGSTTLSESDRGMFAIGATGITVTLPTSPSTGSQFIFKDATGMSSEGVITISGGTHTIDGNSYDVLDNNYAAFTAVFDGSNYLIL